MKCILFVEDEPWGVNPYFNSLERKGYACVSAQSADEAVRHLRREKFDLLSLDVMFDAGTVLGSHTDSARTGIHLLEMIREAQIPNCDPQLKVVVLTAVDYPWVEERMKKLGVLAYLKKPALFDKVIAAYVKALE
ncbi:response regulator [candidate division KSB1 bacterium]|nr:response regulator [candidate division KSB1 bacterium]